MRISPLGAIVSGFNAAAGDLAVTGTPILGTLVTANRASPEAFGPAWLTNAKVALFPLGVASAGPVELLSYHTGTTAQATLLAADVSYYGAGASIWAAMTGAGVQSNLPGFVTLPTAALGDVSTDTGDVAILADATTGQGLLLYQADGSLSFNGVAIVASPPRVHARAGLVAYQIGASWAVLTMAGAPADFVPQLDPTVSVCIPAITGATTYVLERTLAAGLMVLTVRVAGAGAIWTLASGPAILNADILKMSDGTLRIGYSTTFAEAPADIVLHDIDPALSRTRRGTLGAGVIVWSAWTPITTTTLVEVGAATGDGVGPNSQLPPQGYPFVDAQGRLTTPALAWARSLDGSVGSAVNVLNKIPVNGPVHAFEAIASPSQPGFSALTSPILTFVGNGLTITLNPATNTVTFDATSSSGVPVFIASGDTFTVPADIQALFAMTIDNEGTIVVDGYLVQVD